MRGSGPWTITSKAPVSVLTTYSIPVWFVAFFSATPPTTLPHNGAAYHSRYYPKWAVAAYRASCNGPTYRASCSTSFGRAFNTNCPLRNNNSFHRPVNSTNRTDRIRVAGKVCLTAAQNGKSR